MTAEVDIEISDLNKRKRILKGQLTRFEQFLNEPGNLTNKTHLEVRLKKIETAFEEFEKIQTRLEILDESEEDTRSELETRYYDAIAKAKSSLITTPIITQDASTTALSQLINSLSLDPSASGIKLPQIRLPSFAGDYQNWTTFHDTYKRLIHENSKLKNVEKLHHLKTCLKDVALKVIANLETTDDNYDIAWKLLTERFENKRVIINNHIKALLNLPKVTKSSPVLLRELTDNIHTHVSALEKLGLDIKGWEWVLICIISSKLDIVTDLAWEDTLEPNALPTYEQFKKYLTKRCFSLENTANNNLSNNPPQKNLTSATNRNYSKPLASTFAITERNDDLKCHYCNQNHFIYRCPQFTQLDVNQKYSELRKLRLCSNCLRPGHQKHECRSSYCKKCNRDHNTLLHNNHDNRSNNPQNVRNNNEIQANRFHSPGLTTNIVQNTTPVLSNSVPRTPTSVQGTHESHNVRETPQILQSLHVQKRLQGKNSLVLLSTAQILIYDKFGNIHNCRVLLDSGSQSNLISKNLCHRLKLDKEEIHIPIAGVNQTITNITHKTRTVIKSRTSAFRAELTFLVIPKITEKIPSFDFDMPTINYHENICLADPDYNVSNNVDILLGANIFYELLGPNQIKLGDNKPILQETTLGWILTGTIYFSHLNSQNTSMCHFSREMTSNEALNQSLVKFWQIEEFPERKFLSPEEQKAENYYCKTTTRDINGRFIVRLPFSQQINDFGDSQSLALKRFRSLENRFSKNHVLKREYVEFMNEYKKLGHMSLRHEVNMTEVIDQPSYILPHHAVFKESSTTTKCRVVFDGSARSSLGISLNDNLLTGYTVQDDLFSIVMRLRLRKYVLSADIKMMFRQIWVHSDDRKYQTILWRSDNNALQLFTLNTVTYGTTCAPFLATRTLYELASLHEQMYPRTCNIIKTSFYMDDLLTSLDSIEEALEVYSEITQILGSAGFHLRKWSSNSPLILKEILGDNDNTDNLIEFHDNKEAKTLGIAWKIDTDTLKYAVNIPTHNLVTKRTILSDISKIFDPLGLVGPTIIRAKLLMQHLWRQKIEWDEPLSDELHKWWIEFLTQLRNLNNIGIQRQVLCNEPQVIEAHLFCDSSEKALGTAVYLVSTNKHGKTFSNLLCAKSKVAPQARCTLPRLELLSAVLLARLASSVLKILNINISRTTYYTDSTIVLSWLRIDPSRLKTFVANRVAKINELTNINDWRHVSSKYNPADVISRGLNPQELSSLSLWWHGPEFLVDSINAIQPSPFANIEFLNHLPDVKETCTINLVTTENDFNIFDKFSCLLKLQRVISYCLRYKLRVLNKQKFESFRFTADELQHTLYILIKVAQSQRFHEELRSLKNKKPLKSTSKILCLNPFLDSNDILRVGGRLNNSQLNFSQKHPIILPKGHTLTRLIIMHEHTKNLHAGTQNLLATIRLNYWPIDGKSSVKGVIRNCVWCFKAQPKPSGFLMGELPSTRVTPSRPFSRCGLDYCGPILIKDGILRYAKKVKTYVCIFICFATRAIHIDLAKDLTTDSSLNVLKRFISRRGKPHEIFSDNGTNFVGARNHFAELNNLLSSGNHNDRVSNYLSSDKINWKMIPSRSPHLGGFWERTVRSTKFHLKRVLGDTCVTFEEMYTILTQIEACLNSRPLSPLSVDPNDDLPLTPAHFLIGDSLAAMPQEDLQDYTFNRLSRYHRLQQLVQHFWNRWSREYLTTLQTRSKWRSNPPYPPKVGDLVVLVEDNSPPLRWPMGRITELHTGRDNIVRVVSVKVASGSVFKRSLAKVCPLPIPDNFEVTKD